MTLRKPLGKKQSDKKENNYPFIKNSKHFKILYSESIKHEDYHHIQFYQKEFKKNSSADRNTHEWVKIINRTIDEKMRDRLNRLIVLLSEFFIFFIDLDSPKARILDKHIISKKINNNVDFLSYYKHVIYCADNITEYGEGWYSFDEGMYEGIGRFTLGKYYLWEDDFRFENILFADKKVIAIDNDRCLAPISLAFHRNKHRVTYFPLNLEDYENLPRLKHAKPHNWGWNQTKIFSKFLQRQSLFQNEKHFVTIKLLITFDIQLDFINYHIAHSFDKKAIISLMESRCHGLLKICIQSEKFKIYLENNRSALIKIIFYELHNAYKENRHYIGKLGNASEFAWEKTIAKTLNNYSELLKISGLKPLSQEEVHSIKKYADDVYTPNLYTSNYAKAFYIQQKMMVSAKRVGEKNNKFIKKDILLASAAAPKKQQSTLSRQPGFFHRPSLRKTGEKKAKSCPTLLALTANH